MTSCNSAIPVHLIVVVCFSKYQQRLPYDLLSSLARVLLDGTVFEIISSLREVQQLEERNLSNQRIKLINEHKRMVVFSLFCCTFALNVLYFTDIFLVIVLFLQESRFFLLTVVINDKIKIEILKLNLNLKFKFEILKLKLKTFKLKLLVFYARDFIHYL